MTPILLTALAFLAFAFLYQQHAHRVRRPVACNSLVGTHTGSIQRLSDEAMSTRYLLCKIGSTYDHFGIADKGDFPLGVCPDEVAADEVGERRAIELLGGGKTMKLVAGGAIANGARLLATDGGKVIDSTSGAAGSTYWLVGTAASLSANAADGDIIEAITCDPIRVAVVANASTLSQTQAGLSVPSLVLVLGS